MSLGRDPVVSLIMPAWNPSPEFLSAAVDSALSQRGCDVELIVVDDGSLTPVSALLPRDSRLRALRVEHGGPYRARNAGLAIARGAFVRYADADDVLEPDSTAVLVALAHGGAIVHGGTIVCDERLAPIRTIASTLEGRVEQACLLGGFDVRLNALLFPRHVVDAVGPWDTGFEVSGDWDYVLRCLELAPVRRHMGSVTSYRRHPGSLTRRADVAMGERARRRVVERYFERHPDLRGTALERRARAETLLATSRALRDLGDRRGFWRRVVRAAPLAPRATAATVAGLAARRVSR